MKRSSTPTAAPPRWIDGSDDTALSLRAYERAVRGKPGIAFEHFMQGRAKRQTHARVGWAVATALACGGAFALMMGPLGESIGVRAPSLQIAAEKVANSRGRAVPQAESKTPSTTAVDARSTGAPEAHQPESGEASRAPLGAAERGVSSSVKSPKPNVDGRSKAPLQDCQLLAANSKFSEAATCYGKVASVGTSTTAELAWLEKARLEARALGRADLALQTLAAYKAKFPRGALAHEASVAEKRNLAALQRKQDTGSKPSTP